MIQMGYGAVRDAQSSMRVVSPQPAPLNRTTGIAVDGFRKGTALCLVSWLGWSSEHDSWEPERAIPAGLIEAYRAREA